MVDISRKPIDKIKAPNFSTSKSSVKRHSIIPAKTCNPLKVADRTTVRMDFLSKEARSKMKSIS